MKILKWSPFPVLVLLIVMVVINVIVTPNFLSMTAISSFLATYAPLICAAIGSAVVLFGGGIDISLGAIVSLVNVVLITLLGKGYDMVSATLIALGVAVGIGIINGFIIGFLRVNPLLTTFSTSSIAGGLALWIMPVPEGQADMDFIVWYNGEWMGIPNSVFLILFVWLLWFLLKMTPFGDWIYAIGRDEQKAFASAIPVAWLKLFSYVFAAFVTGVGAVALTGSIGSGDPLVGLPISLNAIAACVIGGISLLGGSGDSLGAVFGAIFLGLVSTTVLAIQVPPFYQDLVSGLIILMGIVGSVSLAKKLKFNT